MDASSAPSVIFDLDGTLVDSFSDIVSSFRFAFGELGLDRPDAAVVRPLVGRPLDEMYAELAPAERVADLCLVYRRHYRLHFADRTRPYPGVTELLGSLRERGYRLAVATTKGSAMARALVEAVGLAPYLDHVQGTDGFAAKPAPVVVERALAALGGRGLWMVGDTVHDVVAGRAAGLRTYAVSWGTDDPERLRSAGPDVLAPDLSELLERLGDGAVTEPR